MNKYFCKFLGMTDLKIQDKLLKSVLTLRAVLLIKPLWNNENYKLHKYDFFSEKPKLYTKNTLRLPTLTSVLAFTDCSSELLKDTLILSYQVDDFSSEKPKFIYKLKLNIK